ncbi:MAG TPA: N-acetylmuramoyl-L-alanine amidase, partial [Candidatus Sulfotelmatobacter sp.]|nr:N-acetylmuramoyl-L-alanine amidase [Candidatus Sulfotelmatobacter sp.]
MRHRRLWEAVLVVAVFAGLTVPAAQARVRHSDAWARDRFAKAERLREALNGRPASERTRRDYQRVLNAYRNVYLDAPSSSKADPSVVAVGETLVEMGRRFHDDKILGQAIGQYKFLRREYPGSKYRIEALFTIGEIYKVDLNDSEEARTAFQEFLKHYPHHHLADDARQAIGELDRPAKGGENTQVAQAAENKEEKNEKAASEGGGNENASTKNPEGEKSPVPRAGHLARVTAIRHWSTPDSTRVAVDLEGDVKFSAERITRPARIVFDLHGTRLASTLVGKSFDVGDGLLKKVRVAQFAPGRTHVVLEVDSLSEYDAFLLPNPYRLIIDIHGKNNKAKQSKDASESMAAAAESDRSLPVPDANTDSAAPEQQGAGSAGAPAEIAKSTASAGVSESAARTLSTKPQTTVIKKVVDADDDADTTAKGRKRNKKVVLAKSDLAKNDLAKSDPTGDVDGDSDNSDSKVLESKRNHIVDVPSRSSARASAKSAGDSDFSIREATPTARGDRSLIRALGLKIGKIVIDPGHGGHDTGTIGPNGLEEKDLVLEVSRRLGKLLETRLGAEVVYTRKDDSFIPLETRTAIANQARADLFVSVHANSSHDSAARGVETYYLNFTSSPEALEVAARENAVSEKSIYELQDLVKKIALKEKIEESREFAWDVQQSLHSGLAGKSPAIRDRGVKKAPFIV